MKGTHTEYTKQELTTVVDLASVWASLWQVVGYLGFMTVQNDPTESELYGDVVSGDDSDIS